MQGNIALLYTAFLTLSKDKASVFIYSSSKESEREAMFSYSASNLPEGAYFMQALNSEFNCSMILSSVERI